MKVDGRDYRTIWLAEDGWAVEIIDQTKLPHAFESRRLESVEAAAAAIRDMQVRGAPLIGATAAYGMALAMRADAGDGNISRAHELLLATRPTAVNLRWALGEMSAVLTPLPADGRTAAAYARAAAICDEDAAMCRAIGEHGADLIEQAARDTGRARDGGRAGITDRPVNILTHCNAGWLATVDWGTALAPIYVAHERGVDVHVWVDETRPRNQGASLTAWELASHGVAHTLIVDNAGGHLMQHGMVDLCITGSDRTTAEGDVCNKIGTYLKALAAHDCGVPFHVALPCSTIDWSIADGLADIPIEQRDASEVLEVTGRDAAGVRRSVRIAPCASPAANYAFDVTPARLVSGLITERGRCAASRHGLLELYPERR
ncbi:MAG TPA: S-methyl-5-thioribose-1-phosphate isomerase [Alphaproteobacteria bacterium]|nr:S-methyl-5-thioribose-1-phosphate isomerase [Alphaproteobacteria bacterium]HJN60167.1 S-methyl-5-thioribose-1-phosphate isomerase [Alphaproteobacteria bacterium]